MALEKFSDIWARACERKGGSAAVKSLLPDTLDADEISEYTDAQLLSVMSKRVFPSGFVWRVVDNKWPAYEKAFFDFEPMKMLKKRGTRLGGNTGPYFLRAIGKDTFLLSQDVQSYLTAYNVVDAGFTSQTALRQTQAAFNHWQQESGMSLAHISRIISFGVGDNRV